MTIPLIHDVLLADLRQITDERGSVLHHLRNDSPDFRAFGEAYFSEILPGATKAWKRHRAQTQNLAVPVGRVRFAIHDDRSDSPSRGAVDVVELGRPDDYRRLTIPAGLWYGFQCLGHVGDERRPVAETLESLTGPTNGLQGHRLPQVATPHQTSHLSMAKASQG